MVRVSSLKHCKVSVRARPGVPTMKKGFDMGVIIAGIVVTVVSTVIIKAIDRKIDQFFGKEEKKEDSK